MVVTMSAGHGSNRTSWQRLATTGMVVCFGFAAALDATSAAARGGHGGGVFKGGGGRRGGLGGGGARSGFAAGGFSAGIGREDGRGSLARNDFGYGNGRLGYGGPAYGRFGARVDGVRIARFGALRRCSPSLVERYGGYVDGRGCRFPTYPVGAY